MAEDDKEEWWEEWWVVRIFGRTTRIVGLLTSGHIGMRHDHSVGGDGHCKLVKGIEARNDLEGRIISLCERNHLRSICLTRELVERNKEDYWLYPCGKPEPVYGDWAFLMSIPIKNKEAADADGD